MKSKIINVFAMTGIALLLLSIIAKLYGGHFLCIETVYQTFAVCVVIQLFLHFVEKFESRYVIVELMLKMGVCVFLVLGAGILFHWNDSLPFGVLAVLAAVVFLLGCVIGLFQVQQELDGINQILKGRRS